MTADRPLTLAERKEKFKEAAVNKHKTMTGAASHLQTSYQHMWLVVTGSRAGSRRLRQGIADIMGVPVDVAFGPDRLAAMGDVVERAVTFDGALVLMKGGMSARRAPWHDDLSIRVDFEGGTIKTSSGHRWQPTNDDILAEDWHVISHGEVASHERDD